MFKALRRYFQPQYDPPVQLSGVTPPPEAGPGAPGGMGLASHGDHIHPRLSSVHVGSFAGGTGKATLTFTRTFDAEPALTCSWRELAAAAPVVIKVESYTMGSGPTAGKYVGAVIVGYRNRPIPTNIVTLLLGGVYDLFTSGASVDGVVYHAVFLPQS